MIPTQITEEIQDLYPNTTVVTIGPPRDIAEEDCGSVEALVGTVVGGAFDGYRNYRVYWKPDEEDLKRLQEGHEIQLEIISMALVPHSLGVI